MSHDNPVTLDDFVPVNRWDEYRDPADRPCHPREVSHMAEIYASHERMTPCERDADRANEPDDRERDEHARLAS